MKKRILALLLSLCLLIGLMPMNVLAAEGEGTTLTVDASAAESSGSTYTTIQAAVDAAFEGDTIQIKAAQNEDGTPYEYQPFIVYNNKKGLTFEGVNGSGGSKPVIRVCASDSPTASSTEYTSYNKYVMHGGVYLDATNVTFKNVEFKNYNQITQYWDNSSQSFAKLPDWCRGVAIMPNQANGYSVAGATVDGCDFTVVDGSTAPTHAVWFCEGTFTFTGNTVTGYDSVFLVMGDNVSLENIVITDNEFNVNTSVISGYWGKECSEDGGKFTFLRNNVTASDPDAVLIEVNDYAFQLSSSEDTPKSTVKQVIIDDSNTGLTEIVLSNIDNNTNTGVTTQVSSILGVVNNYYNENIALAGTGVDNEFYLGYNAASEENTLYTKIDDTTYQDEDGNLLSTKPVSVTNADGNVVFYDTLAEAIDEAADGDTVKLLKDAYLESTVTIAADKNVTLDLAGNAITVYKNESMARSLYAIDNYGTFTLTDSVGTGSITARGIENLAGGTMTIEAGTIISCDSNGGGAVWNVGDLTVNGGTFKTVYVGTASDNYGPCCMNNNGGTALITGGTFESVNKRAYAIISTGEIVIAPADGKDVIVSGAHGGLGIDAGTAVINGGTYSSTDYYGLYVSNDGVGEDPMTAAVTVNGGTFTGKTYSVWIGSDYNNPVNSAIAITGGYFNQALNAQDVTSENAIVVYGGEFATSVDTKYLDETLNYEAFDAEWYTYHTTLEEAIAAAGEANNVKWLSAPTEDVALSVAINRGAPLFPGDTFTVTVTSSDSEAPVALSYSLNTLTEDQFKLIGTTQDNGVWTYTYEVQNVKKAWGQATFTATVNGTSATATATQDFNLRNYLSVSILESDGNPIDPTKIESVVLNYRYNEGFDKGLNLVYNADSGLWEASAWALQCTYDYDKVVITMADGRGTVEITNVDDEKTVTTAIQAGTEKIELSYQFPGWIVVGKLFVNGEAAMYTSGASTNQYTKSVSGVYGTEIPYSELEEWAEELALQLDESAVAASATVYRDGGTWEPYDKNYGSGVNPTNPRYVMVDVVTFGPGTLEEITESGEVDGSNITVSNATLEWFAKDTSIGRYADGWWVGVKIIAPESVTAENVDKVLYSNSATGELTKSFGTNRDGDFWMGCWVPVTSAYLEGAINAGSVMQWTYRFDWNGDGTEDQTFKIIVDPANITLNKDGKIDTQTVEGAFTWKDGKHLAHDWSEWVQTKDSTCEEQGEQQSTCRNCGEVLTDALDALGHDWDNENVTYEWSENYGTCTATRICKNDASHIDTAESSYINKQIPVPPTCEEPGERLLIAYFDVDWAQYQEKSVEIPALGHGLTHYDAKAATCTESGWEAYDVCSRCDYNTYVEIEPLGHEWGEITYEYARDYSACTAKRVCERDPSHVEYAYTVDDPVVETKESTCTEPGEIVYTFTFDQDWAADHSVTVEIDAAGHTWGETSYDFAEDGTKCTATRTCSDCGEVETVEARIDYQNASMPTCEESGLRIFTATFEVEWAEIQQQFVELDALGHDLTHYEAKAATCTEIGWDAYDVCSRCDYNTYVEIEPLGHNLTHVEAKAATSSEEGNIEYWYCETCKKYFSDEDCTNAITLEDTVIAKLPTPSGPSTPITPATPETEEPCDAGVNCPAYHLTDINIDTWCHEAVDYVIEKGMMQGYGDNTFRPQDDTSRAMIVAILYRLEGSPAVSGASYSDVPEGRYYTDAVAWAAANGIVTGYSDGTFRPNDAITRQQLAAILYRYAQYKGYDVSVGEDTNILSYSDALSISEYAIPAMQWAVGSGLIQGSNGTLMPKDNTNRGQVATIMMRFCETIAK